MRVEDLAVYQKLCQMHIEICELSHEWPGAEKYELGSQIRRSSNGAPANLAERNNDRHVRNRIEGFNRARGEALDTIHHLYVAKLKKYVKQAVFEAYRERYEECVRMLNGLERNLEKQLPPSDQRWPAAS
jgi:four helix bundle protein